MEYLRLKPDIDSDPDLMEAGWWATRVYELLLKVSAAKDLRGRIPPEYQRLTWLARFFNLGPDVTPGSAPERIIEMGVERLLAIGKLVLEGGDWVIRGWEKFYRPAVTPAERAKAYRDRLKEQGLRHERHEPSRDESDASRTVTEPNTRHATHPPTHSTHPHTPPTGKAAPPPAPAPKGWDGDELLDALAGVFQRIRGHRYRLVPRDSEDLRPLRDEPREEILRRWENGLRREVFPRCESLQDLARHWNSYGTAPTQSGRNGDPRRAPVRAEEQKHGEVDIDAKI